MFPSKIRLLKKVAVEAERGKPAGPFEQVVLFRVSRDRGLRTLQALIGRKRRLKPGILAEAGAQRVLALGQFSEKLRVQEPGYLLVQCFSGVLNEEQILPAAACVFR